MSSEYGKWIGYCSKLVVCEKKLKPADACARIVNFCFLCVLLHECHPKV